MNYFELFGLPAQFRLDGEALAQAYRQLQTRFHPDKFASRPERERLQAVQQAARINDAFSTLKNPLGRAEYLLSLQGVDIRGEQQTLKDPMFLMQQMEWREQLEDIPAAGDVFAAIMAFDRELKQASDDYYGELERQLNTGDWEPAADTVRKLKFMAKLHAELERVEDAQQEF
ncbi:co-chaperone HscB [Oceanimonas baumannii]|uniref:Co-chaperone protein HscB homolog n=1 Tax=Oceanimonas baumannii TaxID=129578 RepID=A0A235CQU6_9GAMM|nr:co-chaperone HscB [Oceanimonas baumannii]MCC4265332.1 co-chaperone HscB [Oceanimonas baumannii]OYD26245.1 co-chaperone HscB [Oceanimonas baumannii]TDW62099.1 molecular chaperone HscB [Oceanimonas baumannii]